MKILSRDFNRGEKALLILLAVILLALCYFMFVYKPVRDGIEAANAERDNLIIELTAVDAKVKELEKMKNEMDDIMNDPNVSMMPSYNNKKEVNKLINDILSNVTYSVTLENLSRNGNMIRRNIQLQFTAPSYAEMERVLERLGSSSDRCLISNVSCSSSIDRSNNLSTYNVSLTATFFETLVGGEPDAALPPDANAA